jgi:hypothetical protein
MALSREIKKAALIGMRYRRDEISDQIRELEQELGGRDGQGRDTNTGAPARKKRVLSAAARRRMAEAQRKRWAAVKTAQQTPAPAKKRVTKAVAKKRTAPVRARAVGSTSEA